MKKIGCIFFCTFMNNIWWIFLNALVTVCDNLALKPQNVIFFSLKELESLYGTLYTLLLRQITGHMEHPNVQQQQIQPQNNHLTFMGRVFLRTPLMRHIVALYSSGATYSKQNTRGATHCNVVLITKLLIQNITLLITYGNCLSVTNVFQYSYRGTYQLATYRQ